MVAHKTEGTAPNRVFTAEWYRLLTYNTNGVTARISFQARLYETSNIIEFHYGTAESGTHGDEGASIGIEDAIGGSGHFIEATTGSTTNGITNLVSSSNWPTVNYRFSPPVANEAFYNVVINKTGSYAEFNANTQVNGSFTVMPGASYNVKNGRTVTVLGTDLR
jgi:hypothetical protein